MKVEINKSGNNMRTEVNKKKKKEKEKKRKEKKRKEKSDKMVQYRYRR